MPGRPSPTVRRRELGVLLRGLRADRGWTVEHVAQQLLCSPSKVSRMETGHRGASARDVRDLCDLYQVGDEQRAHLMRLAREGKQRAWWQPLGLPYSTYVGLEDEAAVIRDFGLGVVPGLLQTAGYARAMVRAAVPAWVPDVIEQRVTGRLARQQLLASDNPPRFEALVDESVLHRVVGDPAVMREQLEHLLAVTGRRSNVSLRVIPYRAGAMPVGHKFIILTFAQPGIPDVVFVEGLTGDLYLESVEDVEAYNATFWSLSELAVSASESREIISAKIQTYRQGND